MRKKSIEWSAFSFQSNTELFVSTEFFEYECIGFSMKKEVEFDSLRLIEKGGRWNYVISHETNYLSMLNRWKSEKQKKKCVLL